MAVGGGDAGDAVRVPDVGVDLWLAVGGGDVFELVEVADGGGAIFDEEGAGDVEGVGVAEAQGGGAVGGDELGGGAGDAPAFAGVVELCPGGAERGAVEDEAEVGLPGPLEEGVAPVDDAFAEVLGGDLPVLEDLAVGLVDEDLRVAFEAGALVEEAVAEEEAFGIAGGGVGEAGEDGAGGDGGEGVGGDVAAGSG